MHNYSNLVVARSHLSGNRIGRCCALVRVQDGYDYQFQGIYAIIRLNKLHSGCSNDCNYKEKMFSLTYRSLCWILLTYLLFVVSFGWTGTFIIVVLLTSFLGG